MQLSVQPNYFSKTNFKNSNYLTKNSNNITFGGIEYDPNKRKTELLADRGKFKKFFHVGEKKAEKQIKDELYGIYVTNDALLKSKDETIEAKEEAVKFRDQAIKEKENRLKFTEEQLAKAEINSANYEKLIKEQMDLISQLKKDKATRTVEDEKLEKMKKFYEDKTKLKEGHGFAKIAGNEKIKKQLEQAFINKLAVEQGDGKITMPNGILFYGPQSTGKTVFARAFAEQAGCNYVEISMNKSDDIILEQLDKAAEDAQKIYETNNKKRTIILLDEFDSIAQLPKDAKGNLLDENSTIIPKLKAFLSNCADKSKCTVFMTTNYPKKIGAEFLTAHRVPIQVLLGPPDKTDAAEIFKYYLKDTNQAFNYNLLADEVMKAKEAGKAYSAGQIELLIDACKDDAEHLKQKITESQIIKKMSEKRFEPDISKEVLDRFIGEATEATKNFQKVVNKDSIVSETVSQIRSMLKKVKP